MEGEIGPGMILAIIMTRLQETALGHKRQSASGRLLEKLGMSFVGRYSLAEYAGEECGPTIRYELWRVETASPQSARQSLEEAAFKIGQFVADEVTSKDEMIVALKDACTANDLVSRIGAGAVSKIINEFLDAGMVETGWLHYRMEPNDFGRV